MALVGLFLQAVHRSSCASSSHSQDSDPQEPPEAGGFLFPKHDLPSHSHLTRITQNNHSNKEGIGEEHKNQSKINMLLPPITEVARWIGQLFCPRELESDPQNAISSPETSRNDSEYRTRNHRWALPGADPPK